MESWTHTSFPAKKMLLKGISGVLVIGNHSTKLQRYEAHGEVLLRSETPLTLFTSLIHLRSQGSKGVYVPQSCRDSVSHKDVQRHQRG